MYIYVYIYMYIYMYIYFVLCLVSLIVCVSQAIQLRTDYGFYQHPFQAQLFHSFASAAAALEAWRDFGGSNEPTTVSQVFEGNLWFVPG